MDSTIVATRRQLHGIAENFIAGPQYRAAGTIRLSVGPDGFAGAALAIAVHGADLVWARGRAPLAGPVRALAEAAGIEPGPPPAEVYAPAAPLDPDAVLDIDRHAAAVLHRCLLAGAMAVKAVVPSQEPTLWPEHFDVGAATGEVNYGVSGGDDQHPLPYAYVGPWIPRTGAFWNAPFGALFALDGEDGADRLSVGIVDFFRRAQAHL